MEPKDYTVIRIEGEYAYLEDETKTSCLLLLLFYLQVQMSAPVFTTKCLNTPS
jgi:hypothetical protein